MNSNIQCLSDIEILIIHTEIFEGILHNSHAAKLFLRACCEQTISRSDIGIHMTFRISLSEYRGTISSL